MNENIKLVIIPGNDVTSYNNRDGKIDFLFTAKYQDKTHYEFDIETVDLEEFDSIKDKISSINKYRKDNNRDEVESSFKLLEHIDYTKEYLNKFYKGFFDNTFLSQFNSNNEILLFRILASNDVGNIIIQNSDYAVAIYSPENITDKQLSALEHISSLATPNVLREAEIVRDTKHHKLLEVSSYQEIINHYKTKENRK